MSDNIEEKRENKWKMYLAIAIISIISIISIALFSVSAIATEVTPATISHTTDHGNTHITNFRITPDSSDDFTLYHNSPFDLEYQNSFSNLGTFVDVPLNITVPKYFPAGTYTSKIFIQDSDETDTVTITTTVPQNRKIEWKSNNVTFSTGQSGVFNFLGENKGNTNEDISFSSTEFFKGNVESYRSIRGQDIEFPLFYNIPNNETLGTRNTTFTITVGNTTSSYLFTYTITDGESPTVNMTDNRTYIFGNNVSIPLNLTDNLDIKSVKYSYDNTTHNGYKEEDIWYILINNTDTNRTSVPTTINVTDIGGNMKSTTFDIPFGKDTYYNLQKLKVIEISKTRIYLQQILNFENKYENVQVTPNFLFTSDDTTLEGGYEVFLEREDTQYSLSSGSATTLELSGPLRIGISSNNPGFLSGNITFKFDNIQIDDFTYEFGVRIGNQDLYQDISISYPYRNSFVNGTCSNNDDGFFLCEFKIPEDSYVGSIPGGQNPVIFSTQKDLEEIKNTYQEQIDQMKKSRNIWMAWSFLFMLGLAIVGLYVLWLWLTKKKGYKFTEMFHRGGDYDD